MSRTFTFRQSAAVAVGAVGLEAVFSAATPDEPARHRLLTLFEPEALFSSAHLLALVAGLALLVLVPKLWQGTRRASTCAVVGLLTLALLNLVKGLDYEEAALDLCLAATILGGRRAFTLGCAGRPRLIAVFAAVGAWAGCYCVSLAGELVSTRGEELGQALHDSVGHPHLSGSWLELVEALIAAALVISLLAMRSVVRPAAAVNGHSDRERLMAATLARQHGSDSLSPFILRPDKAFHFDGQGMLAYRVIGETAIVSGDPVAPPGRAGAVLQSFREEARRRGWQVAVWGSSGVHLDSYRRAGLRAVRAGEEAFVDPARFTLEGRRVRKLRQSVHRLDRRGWQVSTCRARELDDGVVGEIDAVEARWRASQRSVRGFAMSMGPFEPVPLPDDLYLLGRSPAGELAAVMRFASYPGGLSLDTMRRVGETPNGLNEAMLARALEFARDAGVREVSLNYAGLAHLVRGDVGGGAIARTGAKVLLRLLGQRFQMARLVRFDEKFQPEWRSRYLVYDPSGGLVRAIGRVLQAEGYLPERARPKLRWRLRSTLRAWSNSPQVDAAR